MVLFSETQSPMPPPPPSETVTLFVLVLLESSVAFEPELASAVLLRLSEFSGTLVSVGAAELRVCGAGAVGMPVFAAPV